MKLPSEQAVNFKPTFKVMGLYLAIQDFIMKDCGTWSFAEISKVCTLVFMFWENSKMVSTLVQASG